MPAPRPILKALPPSLLSIEATSNPLPFSSCSRMLDSPHVHFPPTPTLTSTEITHSSFIYDRAPIVVTPNICALPERGGRSFFGTQGGLGYFHPHAQFQVDAVRVEQDSSEASTPAISISASVTVGNVHDCGSVGLFRKKFSGPMYDYDYDQEYDQYSSLEQHTHHAQHVQVISSLVLNNSSESLDLGVFCSPRTPYPSSSSPSPSIPQIFLNGSPRNMYDSSTAPPSPSSTASYNNNNAASHSDKPQHKQRTSLDVGGKKRRKNRELTHDREGESRTRGCTQWSRLRPEDSDRTSRKLELEGCLGGF